MRVLIVDDDESILEFYDNVFETMGITEVDRAKSGEEAIGKVVQHEYDLITLDIRMPGMSGIDALALIRNMCPHALIPMISGQFPESIADDLALCADVMIRKPTSLDTFA